MSLRRRSRALALQLLYQRSLVGSLVGSVNSPNGEAAGPASSSKLGALELEPRNLLRDFVVNFEVDPAVADYGGKLFLGVCEHQDAIDRLIEAQSRHWKVSRMSLVDLSLLRIACFELKFSDGSVPAATIMDEAIELAREFGSTDSASFVNGILDPIARAL